MLEITLYLNRGVKVLNGMKETSQVGNSMSHPHDIRGGVMDGRSDGWTDRPNNGWTDPLIGMQ